MTRPLRRRTLLGFGTAALAAGCAGGPLRPLTGPEIDRQVRASRAQLFQTVPGTAGLAQRASGLLIIPNITEAGFFGGGAYGEGGLLIGDAVVDYLSFSAATFGLQIGAQRFAQALFFMTPEALATFRRSDGWELGVDAEFVVINDAAGVGTSTSIIGRPVVAVMYGQQGLLFGATFEGAKYSRLIR